ncbi:hypothetical protein KIN20_013023 [Parelaphostrongylus tenuis]|uniref:Uncharacterized protein n=1 Tax=Parelaphostrongylus tenuis TaxID=148309 RepID=A0AAD5QN72_PARTN|nr:hypothetical protein KIN20_013023 [Parelaphostrongylus tenuis]
MFGKKREVLRRSQIKSEPVQQGESQTQNKSLRPSLPRRSIQRETPEKVVKPTNTCSIRPTQLQKSTPVRVGPVISQKSEGNGAVTRSRPNAEQVAPIDRRVDVSKGLRSTLQQMRIGSDRQARDRTPRANVSSEAATRKPLHPGPVRIGPIQRGPVRGDSFLRNEKVPSERDFHNELNHRKSSLGTVRRTLSSTPKNDLKEPNAGMTKIPQNRGTTNGTMKPRAASVSRVQAPPVGTSSHMSKVRSSSATRPLSRPLSAVRSTAQHSNTERGANEATGIPRSTARPPSITRPPSRQPSVTRPTFSSAARGVAVQSSAQRKDDQRPSQPRSSVIRHVPAKRGGGDGTPRRGFRTELRRYPHPSGFTPLHRRPTQVNEFKFDKKPPQNVAEPKANEVSPTAANGPSPARRLSREELRAMIERLAVPKHVTTTIKTPLRIKNEQTHGVSCVKTRSRSRSTSLSRRPVSAQDHIGGVSGAYALEFGNYENPRCASVEPGTKSEMPRGNT